MFKQGGRPAAGDGMGSLRALIVEDEFLVAMLIEDIFAEMGIAVAAICADLEGGLAAAEAGDFDFALLDINLGGTTSLPIAARLVELRLPFLFASGYGVAGVGDFSHGAPVLQKPFEAQALRQGILAILSDAKRALLDLPA